MKLLEKLDLHVRGLTNAAGSSGALATGMRLSANACKNIASDLGAVHDAVLELLEAAREDANMPATATLDYRDRKAGEPHGMAWWDLKRAELSERGYSMACEFENGSEYFYRSESTPRLLAAIERFEVLS